MHWPASPYTIVLLGVTLGIIFLQMYEDLVVVSIAVDILNLIAEFNSAILRDYTLQTKDTTNEVG